MQIKIVYDVADRIRGELEQVWVDGYKAGVDATLQALGQPAKYRATPSVTAPEVRPIPSDDE
jgi:hypothetical protein